MIHEATSNEEIKHNHTCLDQILAIDIPQDTELYLSHHDRTVLQWFEENDPIAPNIHLARDNDIIDLQSLLKISHPSIVHENTTMNE